MICEYDVKSIKEVKTSLPITLSGYKSYTSDTVGSGARGGTAVLVSNLLSESVFGVDTTSIGDEVWMQIGNIPGVLFVFFYIPPPDSQYYTLSAFSSIEENLNEFMPIRYGLFGDVNARFGKSVKDLLLPLNGSDDEDQQQPATVTSLKHSRDVSALVVCHKAQVQGDSHLDPLKLLPRTVQRCTRGVANNDECVEVPHSRTSQHQCTYASRTSRLWNLFTVATPGVRDLNTQNFTLAAHR